MPGFLILKQDSRPSPCNYAQEIQYEKSECEIGAQAVNPPLGFIYR